MTDTAHRFSLAACPATAWKNGGGATRQIVSWPLGSTMDNFDWRVSVATIEAGGPFSVFAGVDRTIMLLHGQGDTSPGRQNIIRSVSDQAFVLIRSGVHLTSRGQPGLLDHRLDVPFTPFRFSGDVQLECSLIGGCPTMDFNVMCRRGRCQADVQVISTGQDLKPGDDFVLLMCLKGGWRLSEQQGATLLAENEGLWWHGLGKAQAGWRIAPDGTEDRLVVVRVARVDDVE